MRPPPALLLLLILLPAAPGRAGEPASDSTPSTDLPGIMSFAHQPLATPATRGGDPNIAGLIFTPDKRPAPSFGFSADRWWARFPARVSPTPTYIRIDSPSADRLEAFQHCPAGPWRALPRMRARYAVFESPGAQPGCDIMLLEESRAAIRFSVRLLAAADLAQADTETLIGAAIGVAIAVSLMAGFLWRNTGRREFLHFIAYQAATELVILRIWGFVPGVLLSGSPLIGGLLGVAGLNLWVLQFFQYVESSLGVAQARPRLHKSFHILTASVLLAIVGEALHLRFQWPLTVLNMAAGIGCWITVVILQWRTQRRRAIQQVLGYSPVLACFLIFLASLAGHAELSDLRLLFLLGQIGTTLALGYWMALEFRQDRDRRESTLGETVAELRSSRAALERYQSDLESIVASRTAELQRALANERAIVAQQRDFTAMIGHEFRTPLAVIDGQARRIARAEAAEDDLTRRSREIRDAVRDMLGLMDGLLAHTRHAGGGAEYRFTTVPVADIVVAALKNAVPPERLADIAIDCPPEILCRADTVLLTTALGNILGNAAKYSEPGSPLAVAARSTGEAIDIAITDRGVGIATSEQDTVFAKFQRGSNVLTTTGSGLGLFLARQIVEAHGGNITVASSIGQGTCFTVRLPKLPHPTPQCDFATMPHP